MSLLNFFPQVAATYRRPTGTYSTTTGTFVPGSASDNDITIISPQPASGKELLLLPEGDREFNHLKTWTETALQNEDIVTWNGTQFKVVRVGDFNFDGGFYPILMRELR